MQTAAPGFRCHCTPRTGTGSAQHLRSASSLPLQPRPPPVPRCSPVHLPACLPCFARRGVLCLRRRDPWGLTPTLTTPTWKAHLILQSTQPLASDEYTRSLSHLQDPRGWRLEPWDRNISRDTDPSNTGINLRSEHRIWVWGVRLRGTGSASGGGPGLISHPSWVQQALGAGVGAPWWFATSLPKTDYLLFLRGTKVFHSEIGNYLDFIARNYSWFFKNELLARPDLHLTRKPRFPFFLKP